MANSLYIAAMEPGSGKSVVALGVMEMLSRRIRRLGYFRPVVSSANEPDNNIRLIKARYHLDLVYEDMFAYTHEDARNLVAVDIDGFSRQVNAGSGFQCDVHEQILARGNAAEGTARPAR